MEITEKDRRLRLKLCMVLGSLATIASLFFTINAYSQIANSLVSDSWPAVRGKVLSSKLDISTKPGKSQGSSYWPDIQYTYEVAGKKFEANKVLFINDGFGKDWAMKKVASYPKNSVVEVSYNPEEPSIATLETRLPTRWYLFTLGTALAFILVFAGLACFFFRDARKMYRLGQLPN